MQANGYKFDRLAKMMFLQMDSDEQAQIRQSLTTLFATPLEQWFAAPWHAKKLPNEPTYRVHLHGSLRAFVALDEGQPPKVMDFVHQETLDLFAKSAANAQQ
jgi:hypothetical protein